jgi:hypothetical protein
MKRFFVATAVFAVALTFWSLSAGGANGPYDFAVGAGDRGTPTGGLFVHHFALSAHDGPNGPSGSYVSRSDVNALFSFNGRVTCLFVDGNRAVVGGEITKRYSSEQQNGFMVAFEDNGPPAGGVTMDRISLIDLERATPPTQADCATEGLAFFGLFRPMLSGNVTIYDAP